MVQYCVAYNCKTKAGDGYSFFKFPEDPWLRTKWFLAVRRKNFIPSKYSRLCAKHFVKEDFDENRTGFSYLKVGAIPSIFDFSSNTDSDNESEWKNKIPSVTIPKENVNREFKADSVKNNNLENYSRTHITHFYDWFTHKSTERDNDLKDTAKVKTREDITEVSKTTDFKKRLNNESDSGVLKNKYLKTYNDKHNTEVDFDDWCSDNSNDWNGKLDDIVIADGKDKEEQTKTSKTTNFPLIIKIGI